MSGPTFLYPQIAKKLPGFLPTVRTPRSPFPTRAARFARTLGIDVRSLDKTGCTYDPTKQQFACAFENSDSYRIAFNPPSELDAPVDQVYTPSSAQQQAQAVLESYGLWGDWDSALVQVTAHHHLGGVARNDGNGAIANLWDVVFRFSIQVALPTGPTWIPVTGSGAKMLVSLDAGGNPRMVYKFWRMPDVDLVHQSALKDLTAARTSFEQGALWRSFTSTTHVAVLHEALAWYAAPPRALQSRLYPVLISRTSVKGPIGNQLRSHDVLTPIAQDTTGDTDTCQQLIQIPTTQP